MENKTVTPAPGAVEAGIGDPAGALPPRNAERLPWSQLTIDEKAERLHYVVKLLDRRLAALNEIEQRIRQIERHRHASNGDTLVPIESRNGGAAALERAEDPNAWF
jgi:hypothetical protein